MIAEKSNQISIILLLVLLLNTSLDKRRCLKVGYQNKKYSNPVGDKRKNLVINSEQKIFQQMKETKKKI